MNVWALLFCLSGAVIAQNVYLWPESFNLQNGRRFTIAIHSGEGFPESQEPPSVEQVKESALHVPKYQYSLENLRQEGNRTLVDGVAKTRGNFIVSARCGAASFAKALLMTELPGEFGMQPVGLAFEIVPLTNPANTLAGQRLPVQVLMNGQAAGGVAVDITLENGDPTPAGKTDAGGKLSILLPRGGAYRLRAVLPGPQPSTTSFVFALR